MAKDWKNSRMEGEILNHGKEMMEKALAKKVEGKLQAAYKEINSMIEGKYPNKETRELVKTLLGRKIDFECTITCDETNNPPRVADEECIIAHIAYDIKSDGTHKYMHMVFGDERRANSLLADLQA